MKLQDSKLCVNCESLYEGTTSCPYCQSEVFVWLFRALGTTIDPNVEEMDNYSAAIKETPALRSHIHQSDFPKSHFVSRIMGCRSFAEFRVALGWVGREMVRVLTLGMVQAYK
jgi:RNA polymerase subunit RPABC4/transcription elongation factor Spt4